MQARIHVSTWRFRVAVTTMSWALQLLALGLRWLPARIADVPARWVTRGGQRVLEALTNPRGRLFPYLVRMHLR